MPVGLTPGVGNAWQGQEIIDGPGGMWNLQVGYGERRIAEAIGQQALTMAYNSPWHNTR